eukprot:CAMPEP_0184728492 /NCGR_PEP_ID=MMETSP0314-20130426/40399_1 /TAXON_ID=38298 /ORGANISM="Rhodella maculata, Strain CCMP 736" /LENGTH=96 /DNA_ID=CAMNT_0027194341 /DNA_START=353 /DNA_END=643 /DNA_ORIENTATION=+
MKPAVLLLCLFGRHPDNRIPIKNAHRPRGLDLRPLLLPRKRPIQNHKEHRQEQRADRGRGDWAREEEVHGGGGGGQEVGAVEGAVKGLEDAGVGGA